MDFARRREFTFTIHNASRPSIAGRLGPGSLVTPNSCSFGFGSHRVTEPALSLPGFRCIDKSIIGEHIPMAPTDTGQLRNLDTTKPTSKDLLPSLTRGSTLAGLNGHVKMDYLYSTLCDEREKREKNDCPRSRSNFWRIWWYCRLASRFTVLPVLL